jgi:AraC-like DNA-binding protein
LGAGWSPRGVEFAHERLAAPAAYQAIFDAPVTFGGSRNALLFSAQDLLWRSQSPYYRAKPAFEAHLRDLVLIDTHDYVANVSRLIRALLPGEARVEDVAAELALSPRSLQRKLSEHGTSFTALLTQARVALAQDYLRHPGVTITEVADRLGFANVSTLSRLLRRELDDTPSGVKAKANPKSKRG